MLTIEPNDMRNSNLFNIIVIFAILTLPSALPGNRDGRVT